MTAPRMRDESWPAWAKTFWIILGIALVLLGIGQMIQSRHGEWVLGLIGIIAGIGVLIGWLVSPRWIDAPE